jgi:hypothetical protein
MYFLFIEEFKISLFKRINVCINVIYGISNKPKFESDWIFSIEKKRSVV